MDNLAEMYISVKVQSDIEGQGHLYSIGFFAYNWSEFGNTGFICSKVVVWTSTTSAVHISVHITISLEGQGQDQDSSCSTAFFPPP